ncbi:MAG TPA: Ku protein, partial [Thermoanaerobaculia bacterium]|nr:Ku protein [Thermoanaerobaculia bacterium]
MAEENEDQPSGLRSFWTGTITFGLVSVPVALFPANRGRGSSLKMVDEGGTPLSRRYVCSKTGDELDDDDIVRGYEIEKGKFVVITDEELEAIEPRKSREIDLQTFVPMEEIDPRYFERAYFLTPTGGSNKAYRLLAEVMEKNGRAGIATFVMRAKEYLVAILSENGILRAETLRFADEVRKPADVGLPKKPKAKPADVKKFETLIGKHAGKVNFREFLDPEAERLEKLVAKKQKDRAAVVKSEVQEEEDAGGGEVVDLLEVLSRSLGGSRKGARKAPARKRT